MFPQHQRKGLAIGQQNGSAARAMLARRSIPVVSESLYGNGHRQILFNIASGDVWVRQPPPVNGAGGPSWNHAA